MEAVSTFETSAYFSETTRCNIPEDSRLHNHRHFNLKSHLREYVSRCICSLKFVVNDAFSVTQYVASNNAEIMETRTNQCRLNSGNACYHSVQSLLSSRLLSRNVKVKI
jgi:hypothetical protein